MRRIGRPQDLAGHFRKQFRLFALFVIADQFLQFRVAVRGVDLHGIYEQTVSRRGRDSGSGCSTHLSGIIRQNTYRRRATLRDPNRLHSRYRDPGYGPMPCRGVRLSIPCPSRSSALTDAYKGPSFSFSRSSLPSRRTSPRSRHRPSADSTPRPFAASNACNAAAYAPWLSALSCDFPSARRPRDESTPA